MKVQLLPAPKPPKVPHLGAPKIASVRVTKLNSGFMVQHNMTHGPKPLPFVFTDPRKMRTHLQRLANSQWRQPDHNPGPSVNRILNTQTL